MSHAVTRDPGDPGSLSVTIYFSLILLKPEKYYYCIR